MGDAVRQMFAAIAQHYDVLNTVLSFGLHHYWRQQVVTVSGIPSGARLLDVCSGTADLAHRRHGRNQPSLCLQVGQAFSPVRS